MTFSIIGSGNLAWHLAKMGVNAGHILAGIWSRNLQAGKEIALLNHASFLPDIEDALLADICFIALADHAIAHVAESMPSSDCLVVHTSGIMTSSLLQKYQNYGVCWPAMGLKKHIKTDYSKIPFCIETPLETNSVKLLNFFKPVSDNLHRVSKEQRQFLHLSAVFANNFVTLMQRLSAEICINQNLDFSIMIPMAIAHTENLKMMPPAMLQTGVASRKDSQAMASHHQLLQNYPELLSIYTTLSEAIISRSNLK